MAAISKPIKVNYMRDMKVEITVMTTKGFRVRNWIALQLIRLAACIMPCNAIASAVESEANHETS